MPSYLVEAYHANRRMSDSGLTSRARAAAAELASGGMAVRFLGSISVPDDELIFHLFEAPSPDVAAEASKRATIEFERIVEIRRLGFDD